MGEQKSRNDIRKSSTDRQSQSVSSNGFPHRTGYHLSLDGSYRDPWLQNTLDLTLNEIHGPIVVFIIYLTRGVIHKGLDKCFCLDSIFSLPATYELLA